MFNSLLVDLRLIWDRLNVAVNWYVTIWLGWGMCKCIWFSYNPMNEFFISSSPSLIGIGDKIFCESVYSSFCYINSKFIC